MGPGFYPPPNDRGAPCKPTLRRIAVSMGFGAYGLGVKGLEVGSLG